MRSLSFVLFLGIAWIAFSQPQPSQPPRYDKTSEAVFKGSVLATREHPCPVSGGIGAHLLLQTADGNVFEVHLATARLIREYGLSIHAGEVVEITGVKITFAGSDAILARKMKRGAEEFIFRDNEGNPIW